MTWVGNIPIVRRSRSLNSSRRGGVSKTHTTREKDPRKGSRPEFTVDDVLRKEMMGYVSS